MEEVLRPLVVFAATLAATIALGAVVDRLLNHAAQKHPANRLPGLLRRVHLPLQVFLATIALHFTYPLAEIHLRHDAVVLNILAAVAILSAAWVVMRAVDAVAENTLDKYAHRTLDIAKVRRLHTQLTLVRRIITTVLAITTAAVAILLLFPNLRTLGTSLLASAGIIGVIAGVAAQSTLGNLVAGLQIAFGDSVKIGDTVVVEGEWGTVICGPPLDQFSYGFELKYETGMVRRRSPNYANICATICAPVTIGTAATGICWSPTAPPSASRCAPPCRPATPTTCGRCAARCARNCWPGCAPSIRARCRRCRPAWSNATMRWPSSRL